MRNLLFELSNAQKTKIYKNDDFEKLLRKIVAIETDNLIHWDAAAGEEWAYISNANVTFMLNRRIGICFARGPVEAYLEALRSIYYVRVDAFDKDEWFIDLCELQESVPEITWHAADDVVDVTAFSLDELYFATV